MPRRDPAAPFAPASRCDSCHVLEVIEPGLLTTVQVVVAEPDLRRHGRAHRRCVRSVVAVSGKRWWWRPANECRARDHCRRSRVSRDRGLRRGRRRGRHGQCPARRSSCSPAARCEPDLRAGARRIRVRTYLAMAGSIDVPEILGARSTCLVGGFGGVDGRPLPGDLIRRREAMATPREQTWAGSVESAQGRSAVPGQGCPRSRCGRAFSGTLDLAWHASIVSGRGDRQGIRLDGRPVASEAPATTLSRG